jgi:hypothetical protein
VDRSWGNINCHRHMNVEIGTKAPQFPEKEHINGIFVAVHGGRHEGPWSFLSCIFSRWFFLSRSEALVRRDF